MQHIFLPLANSVRLLKVLPATWDQIEASRSERVRQMDGSGGDGRLALFAGCL